jgi:hypothetical protein
MTREIRQERFTTLDRRIAERLAPGRLIEPRRLALTTDGASRARLVARLGVLAQLGVAERLPAGSWRLREDWEGALRALGERGDIIKRMHAAVHGRADAGRFVVLDGSAGRATVEGIVRRKGLHDELGGDQFAVVESAQGRAYYVRLDATAAEQVREGALVRVEATAEPWAKRIDQAIAAAARDAGGVYDPVAHLRDLEVAPPSIGGRLVDPKDVVAANVRRLERLSRYRIVTRAAGAAWKVPANLLGILAARETTHPRVRTTVDVVTAAPLAEVRRLRPTWLDAEKLTDPTRAPYGFGAEISAAVRARSSFLEGLGIAAEGSERTHLLERAAERAVGEEFARARGATLVADPPPGFRGRLSVRDGHDGGPSVAVVIDEIKRAVVVLPATAVSPELVGQVVELGRDGSGRLVPQRSGLIRGE